MLRRLLGLKPPVILTSKRWASQLKPSYDLVIVGGGMVGCALAASAGNSKYFEGKSILVVDSTKPKVWEDGAPPDFDTRVSTVSPGNVQMMEKMGAWNIITALRPPQEVKQLRVWDSCSNSSIHFEYPNSDDNVAFIVENTALLTGFWRRMQEMWNVETIFDGGAVKQCRIPFGADGDQLSSISLENGTTVTAKLLVGADGFKSVVRKAMNVHEVSWDYQQKGIVCNLEMEKTDAENNIGWQRFTPTGPIALLPLNQTTSNLIWTTSNSEATRLMSLQPREFIDELNAALFSTDNEYPVINSLLGTFVSSDEDFPRYPPAPIALQSQLGSFPLGFQHATNYVKTGVALVGDAAHRIHPLAGQGVNLGFRDVACLMKELEREIGRGEKFGSLSTLQLYETQRQWENLSVMMTVDGLNRLYGTSWSPIVFMRSVGLNAVNRLSFMKDFFMKRAAA